MPPPLHSPKNKAYLPVYRVVGDEAAQTLSHQPAMADQPGTDPEPHHQTTGRVAPSRCYRCMWSPPRPQRRRRELSESGPGLGLSPHTHSGPRGPAQQELQPSLRASAGRPQADFQQGAGRFEGLKACEGGAASSALCRALTDEIVSATKVGKKARYYGLCSCAVGSRVLPCRLLHPGLSC